MGLGVGLGAELGLASELGSYPDPSRILPGAQRQPTPTPNPTHHQVLSDGMLNYLGARKLADTPFPFPYAQLNAGFCLVIRCLFPFVVAAKVPYG